MESENLGENTATECGPGLFGSIQDVSSPGPRFLRVPLGSF
jgi:hypothetical protein